MDLVVSVRAAGGMTDSVIEPVARFERIRIFGTLAILGVMGLACLSLDSKVPSVIAAAAFVVIACLGFGWLRAIRRARSSARALDGPVTLTLTDDSIGITSRDRNEALAWKQLMHGSETASGWLFVAKRSHAAYLIPRSALTVQQAEELSGFLATWPKRRMRRVPASRR